TCTESTTVMPSISVSSGAAVGNCTSLSMNNCELEAGMLASPEFPLLIVLTDTGVFVPGISAALAPLTKNPNTSSKTPTCSVYSSDAKTYWKLMVLPTGTKSNSSTAASMVAEEFAGSSVCR